MRTITRSLAALAAGTLVVLSAAACQPSTDEDTLTFRLWDPQVADAYRDSFQQFEAETGIAVDVVVVPWADYASQLRVDIASGVADDVFWANAAEIADLATTGTIQPVPASQVSQQQADWAPSVVDQYTIDDTLWGVPQLSDPGIAIIANEDLLAAAGISIMQVAEAQWDPAADTDSLRETSRQLTVDANGRHPGADGFDPDRVERYGYGAANDLNAILLPFLGSNGAAWQDGDRFVFASKDAQDAIGYLADLIDTEHVAPPAADTNPPTGGDFVRDQFLQGRIALFQTGAYNLSNVLENADFSWSLLPIPEGPAGRISVTNGIVAAANATTDAPEQQRRLLEWLGSPEGQQAIGASGTASPAALSAQVAYLDFWADQGVDLSPMYDVLENGTVQAPQGQRYQAASNALQPFLNDVFLTRLPLAEGLRAAEDAANEAMTQE